MAVPKKIESEIMEDLDKFTEYVSINYGHGKEKTLQYMKTVIDYLLPKKEDVADIKECKKVEFTFTEFLMYENILHVSGCDTATNTEEVSNVSTEVLTEIVTKNSVSTSTEEDVFNSHPVMLEIGTNTEEVAYVSTEVFTEIVAKNSVSTIIAPETPDNSPTRVQNTIMCSNTCISPLESKKHVTNTKDGYMVYKMSELMEYFEYEYTTLYFTFNKEHLDSHIDCDPKFPKKKEGFYIENNGDFIFVNMSCMYGIVPFVVQYSKKASIENKPYIKISVLKQNIDIFRVMFPHMGIDKLISNMTKNIKSKFFLKEEFLDKMTLLLQFAFDKNPTAPMFDKNQKYI
jgi:hypothetical protein